ncbi:MAG: hypothetical protein K8R74_12475, partial [Bacteroidales bacterium]|nr:hypothetical protein [Bacteroidales bacterium]
GVIITDVTVNPYELTGLSSGSMYDFYVRAVFDTTNSYWSLLGSFETLGAIPFDIAVFLEGPYNGIGMITTLNNLNQIPLDQPYDTSPWNYTGTESVSAIPNTNIVDWVLVELRETSGDVTTATAETMIARQAGFLLYNGSVVGLDGISHLTFDIEINENIYVVIRHRNHLDIISANLVTYTGGVYTYNFAADGNTYGDWNGHKELVPGIYGMIAGDGYSDGVVNDLDKSPLWDLSSGKTGYLPSDYNFDGEINNIDKDFYWFPNIGRFSQVPGDIFACGQQIIDQRDGQSYNTVLIGNQCWMAENLNVGDQIDGNMEQTDNAVIEKYCYSNNSVNCDDLGGLYQWDEVMEYQLTEGVQGICPDGWHVPTTAEYKILEGNTDSQYPVGDPEWDILVWRGFDVGLNLKSTSGWLSDGNGLDLYGFTVLSTGFRLGDGYFAKLGNESHFWTSTNETTGKSWVRRLDGYEDRSKNIYFIKEEGRSVRCLKD